MAPECNPETDKSRAG